MNNKKNLKWQLPFLALLIIGTVLILVSQRNVAYQANHGIVFGTYYNITYQYGKDLGTEIKQELQMVDDALSPYNSNSTITAVNDNQPVKLDELFLEIFTKSMQVSADTDGAFDITVAPLVNQWGFGFKTWQFPDEHIIDSIRQFIGYEKIKLENGTIKKSDPRMMLDCSSIAKGFGCDRVARLLRSKGIKNFLVEIGGEIVSSGMNQQDKPWKIGVTKPLDDSLSTSQEIQTVLNLTDCAMATSGNYRKFYIRDGKKYAHTIDPKTGFPVQHNILSATVIAPDCATADAYSTAFMVMGFDKAQKVLERHPEMAAYFIYSDSTNHGIWFSPSLKDKIDK
ncbi:MAG: FAD:protein FMN transferase [Prevotella sp.]|nr:FAD:protein FMN transferase [Prevotella sp.]